MRNPCGEIVLRKGLWTRLGLETYVYTVRIQAMNGTYYTIPVTLEPPENLLAINFQDRPTLIAETAYKIGQKNFGGLKSIDMSSIKQVKPRWRNPLSISISTLLNTIKYITPFPQRLRLRVREER